MDQSTRNKLQNATQEVRRLLEHEFAEQLEGTYDILPNGTIQSNPGKHLDSRERLVREKLVAAIEHIKAGGKKPFEAVDEYTREAAFTFLNRFVALKMLEARGLVQQCVSKGDQSSGFKEFTGLAPGLAGLPDKGYRLYLECLFDELSIEVKVLFDRRDPASLLWPRRQALTDLLAILNQPELAGVWDQDETIGWVYQYFNSRSERKAARYGDDGKERPPESSRELAIRNQYFTPRYVVEFLTDNTLGRIWYEMRGGKTRLVEQCRYLVRRPTEIFLAEGEAPSEQESVENLSQEELLKQPEHIPFRPRKDPRDLKILDPACGSGHFLLYCFDLLLMIYEEGWADEQAPPSEITGKRLREDNATIEALREAVPGLILRHNLHGIDIDPRCAQIAAFALWMRAQRAYNEFGHNRASRPSIRRTNIVVAEPMPGEEDLLREFAATLQPPLLGQLVEVIFDKMQLAGEAGSLLKIEEELRDAIAKARKAWTTRPHAEQMMLFGEEQPKAEQLRFDLSGITHDRFWHEAETRVALALRQFAERRVNGNAFRRALFSDDAASGFAFIDHCRARFDVLLMNPPFGDPPLSVQPLIGAQYRRGRNDIYTAFVLRAIELVPEGTVGTITSRSFITGRDHRDYRSALLDEHGPALRAFLDLGPGVLDEAGVETAAYTLSRCRGVMYIDARHVPKNDVIAESFTSLKGRLFVHKLLAGVPSSELLFHLSEDELRLLANTERIEPSLAKVTFGLTTKDNFRFIRLRWEVPPDRIGPDSKWTLVSKGGEYSWFSADIHLVVNRWKNSCEMAAEAVNADGNIASTRRSSSLYFRPGVTFSRRSQKGFSARRLCRDVCFSDAGGALVPSEKPDEWAAVMLVLLSSIEYLSLIRAQSTYGHYEVSSVKKLPCPKSTFVERAASLSELYQQYDTMESYDEKSQVFLQPAKPGDRESSSIMKVVLEGAEKFLASIGYRLDPEVRDFELLRAQEQQERTSGFAAWVSYAVGVVFCRWDPAIQPPRDVVLRGVNPFAPRGGRARSQTERSPEHRGFLAALDDPGHSDDLSHRAQLALNSVLVEHDRSIIGVAESDVSTLRHYLRYSFFADHLGRYTRSKRSAPIYWQLATPLASYSVWLYYNRFTRDTFFKVLHDSVKPKLDHEQRKLDRLRADAVSEQTRSQRGEIDQQETFVAELRSFAEEIERIAPLWNPDLDDGVIINFAPLWRLVPQHKAWQKECKACWDKLIAGDYDWAHLAMHLWPERVVPKCRTDASLAIAHGLEDVFWEQKEVRRTTKTPANRKRRVAPKVQAMLGDDEQVDVAADDELDDSFDLDGEEGVNTENRPTRNLRWVPRDEPPEGWDDVIRRLVAERIKPAVKAALKSLLDAPAPAGNGKTHRARRKTKSR